MELSDIFSGSLTPAKWRALGEHLQSATIQGGPRILVRQVGNKTIINARKTQGSRPRSLMPFEVTVEKVDDVWKAKVARGVVGERIIGEDIDTVSYWVPTGMLDSEGESIELTVANGDGIFVVVNVLESGQIGAGSGDEVAIEVSPADAVSVSHFVPAVADESGTVGTYKYRLGTITITGDECNFEADLAGSNIDHWVDLPSFEKQAGDYDIFKKFDITEKAYKYKGITEDLGDSSTRTIKITDTGDELKFATDGGNLNLAIKQWVENSGGFMVEGSIVSTLYWRNGLFIGDTDPEDSPTGLIEQVIAVIEQSS